MKCTICQCEVEQVTYLAIFTHGSEGNFVCYDCRTNLAIIVRSLQSIAARARLDGVRIGRAIKENKL